MVKEEQQQSMKQDIIEQIEKLDVLREKGFITSEAYEKKKRELLELLWVVVLSCCELLLLEALLF